MARNEERGMGWKLNGLVGMWDRCYWPWALTNCSLREDLFNNLLEDALD